MRGLDSLENYNYLWDDVWLIGEKENEITSEWPKGPSRPKPPSDEDQ